MPQTQGKHFQSQAIRDIVEMWSPSLTINCESSQAVSLLLFIKEPRQSETEKSLKMRASGALLDLEQNPLH